MNAGFMLDTSAINRILDEKVYASQWTARGPIYVTDIQIQELARTPQADRRKKLLQTLFSLRPSVVPPDSRPRYYEFGDLDEPIYQPAHLGRMMPIMAAALGRKVRRHFPDALMTEAAIASGLTLVTADSQLAEMARAFGAAVEAIP